MDFGQVCLRNVASSWERAVPMEALERSTLLSELLFSQDDPSDPPVLEVSVQDVLLDSWLRYVNGSEGSTEAWSDEDLVICLKASDFLGDAEGVSHLSSIIGKLLFLPPIQPTKDNLLSCLSVLKLEPSAVSVLGSLPETLWAAVLTESGASFDMCSNRLPKLFLTPSRLSSLHATFSCTPTTQSPSTFHRRRTSTSTAADTGTPLSTSTVSPLVFSMDLPWGKASYCVSDSTQVDSSCVRMEGCVIDAPYNPDTYAPGLASEFLEALGEARSTLAHLQIEKFFPKSEVYFREHPEQGDSPVPKCSSMQFLAPGLSVLGQLRHLDLSNAYQCDNCSLTSFVAAIGVMRHLSYLNLGHLSVRRETVRCTFDSVLSKLSQLQFLALRNVCEVSSPLESLASAISHLSQLTGLVLNKRVSSEKFLGLGRPSNDSEASRSRVDGSCLMVSISCLLQLQHLDLSSIPTSDKLSHDIVNPGDVLRKFVRPGFLLGDPEIESMAGGCYPRMQVLTMITNLNLAHSSITDQGAMALGACLFRLKSLRDFDFSYNDVRDRGAQYIATSLSDITTLQRLNVSGKSLLKEGAAAYSSGLQTHPTLHELIFEGMDRQSSLIMHRLLWTLPKVTSLVIKDPEFNERSAEHLASCLHKNSVLKSLKISGFCNVSSAEALLLAPALATLRSLTHLTFASPGIEEQGAVAFCASLAWTTNLEELQIRLGVFLEFHCCKVLQASLQWLGKLPDSRKEEVFLECAGSE